MANIVDNRKKDFAVDNRKKYMERQEGKIRRSVIKKIGDLGIQDIAKGHETEVTIDDSDIEEGHIGYNNNKGSYDRIGTGNDKYKTGDSMPMPPSGGGRGNEGDPEGADSEGVSTFTLTAKEFMDYFFDHLGLPFQFKKIMTYEDSNTRRQAGFVTQGSPNKLSVIRTYRNSIARTSVEYNDYIEQLEKETDEDKRLELEEKIKNIPLFRDVDLRFVNYTTDPAFKFKSVMFCILDVSGSVEEEQRLLAKKFFLLLYVFLKKCYTSVDIVFIRHTTQAEEVDEKTFFYDDMSGGTVLSCALEKVDEIIKERYIDQNYNIYIAQASDGDNFIQDNVKFYDILQNVLLPYIQYYAYIELPYLGMYADRNMSMYGTPFYKGFVERFKDHVNCAAKIIARDHDIYKVFIKLFQKRIEDEV